MAYGRIVSGPSAPRANPTKICGSLAELPHPPTGFPSDASHLARLNHLISREFARSSCLVRQVQKGPRANKGQGSRRMMKRLSSLALAGVLTIGLSMPSWAQNKSNNQKPPDPCAQFKTAPKGESAADKKKRLADLKTCTDKQKADEKAAKQQSKPASKSTKKGKKG